MSDTSFARVAGLACTRQSRWVGGPPVVLTLKSALLRLERALVQKGGLSGQDAEAPRSQADATRHGFSGRLFAALKVNELALAKLASRAVGMPRLGLNCFDV